MDEHHLGQKIVLVLVITAMGWIYCKASGHTDDTCVDEAAGAACRAVEPAQTLAHELMRLGASALEKAKTYVRLCGERGRTPTPVEVLGYVCDAKFRAAEDFKYHPR